MVNRIHPSPTKQATAYRPILREVAAEVLTPAGWIGGTIVLPQLQGLVDHLSKTGPIVKLTSVRLPGRGETVPFFALQSLAAILVVPEGDDRGESEGATAGHPAVPPAGHTSLPVTFLLEHGVLDGRLAFPAGLRLSDYLRQQTGFVAVRDAVWTPNATTGAAPAQVGQELPDVLVNAARLIGVAEAEPRGAED